MLTNPYNLDPPDNPGKRISTQISDGDYHFIRCIRPASGTIGNTITNLWSKLCNKLREHEILDVTKQDEFETFVNNLVVLSKEEYDQLRTSSLLRRGLPDRSIGGVESESLSRNDDRGEKECGPSHSTITNVPTNLQSGGRSSGSTENKKKGQVGTKNKRNGGPGGGDV